MTLNEYRELNHLTWLNIARQLTLTNNGSIYDNRLSRLRNGSVPTHAELKALQTLTKDEVDSYEEEK
jgi:hypothetical protein